MGAPPANRRNCRRCAVIDPTKITGGFFLPEISGDGARAASMIAARSGLPRGRLPIVRPDRATAQCPSGGAAPGHRSFETYPARLRASMAKAPSGHCAR